jgi:hypothetical protein
MLTFTRMIIKCLHYMQPKPSFPRSQNLLFGTMLNQLNSFDTLKMNSVGITTGYGSGFNSPQGQEIFRYFTASRPALGPTQLPIRWVPGELSPRAKLTIHLNQVPRSIMMELHLHSPMYLHGVVLN